VQDKIDISAYFKTTASEDEILQVKNSLESLSEVKRVDYVSRDQALQIFQERHKDDQTIASAISQLDENPLAASINVKANKPQQYANIASYLENESLKSLVDKVSYRKNEIVIQRLTAMIDTVERGGLALTAFLSIIAGLVVFNTIRLAIYSNREEIGIMRLVGASDRFIRGPYVVEGVMYGVIAAVIGIAISFPIIYFASPYIEVLIPEMNLKGYFSNHFFSLLGYQILFGVGLGIVSSMISIRRHLKV